MMKTQTEPTEQDIDTLQHALYLERRFQAGIFPNGGAQTAHFDKLVRFGMLEFTGEWGRDIDGMVDRDVLLYRLTEQGRTWIQTHDRAPEEAPTAPERG
jgi:hypothetical protein